jgi:hypothetical protein
MHDYCVELAAGDPRIEFRPQVDHDGLLRVFSQHDVVVVPSRWETNANTAREALMLARPVLATPTGGLMRVVEDGVNGWLTTGTSAAEIAQRIEQLLDDRDQVDRLVGSQALRESLSRSVQNDEALAAYLEEANREPAPTMDGVSVGALVSGPPGPALDATLASVHNQATPVADLRTEVGSAPTGVELPAGDAVALVPAGAELSPSFVSACARALAASPDAAYATTWAAADDPWRSRPLGNGVPLVETEDCGGAVLVIRSEHAQRAAAAVGGEELAGGGAWLAARQLRRDGEHGVVVPEELAQVRDIPGRADVESRRAEVEAALLREDTRWSAPTGLATA